MINAELLKKIAKVSLIVAGAGVSIASNLLSEKEQDAKLSAKIAEALAKQNKES